ncbi:MmcQ/YjbR family DNA-binding protein [Paenibacillus qinlingensis]|uniref:DNA-binding protein (MmcQ/YjbR family) n=1 Tax=Paenibacillus qinlingensis TaxID=1837343 RepID=A0ABU1NYC5_9BACL|nr:MmcQ/YjbR family DNA-binding protein [Paenibacillus qinlingensis]MDR6552066.1 putative DNA-binding protein (MmcQ/YjbR family) [Paenibacillus qinlingensis]
MSHHQLQSPSSLAHLARIRDFCTKLPEVEEKADEFGHTTFRVKDKPFIMLGENDGQVSTALKTELTTQEFLLGQEGTAYQKTPYIGRHGWVSIWNVDLVPWTEIQDLIVEGYARTAPKKLVQQLKSTKS